MLIPSWAEEEVIRSEPWVSSRQLPNSGRTFWPLSFPPQMKVDRPCFLRWLLPPVSHFSESLLHQPIPVSWALILVLSLQSDPPSPGLRYLLLFSSLPQSGLDFASLVLSTLQSGFCSDHASLETPCKEIVNGLSRTKRLPWRSGGCGPPTVKPTLCAPGAVLLPLSLSWGHFFFRLSSLTTNSCVSQAFSPSLFFQFPFSSLDSYRRFPSSPQSQPPLGVAPSNPVNAGQQLCFRTWACRSLSQRSRSLATCSCMLRSLPMSQFYLENTSWFWLFPQLFSPPPSQFRIAHPSWCGLERCWNYLALSTEKPLLVSNHLEATKCSGTDRPHGLMAWPQQAHLARSAPAISRVSLTTNISLSPRHILLTPRLFFLIKILSFSSLPGKFPIWPNSHDQILRPFQFIMKISSNHCW